jgi:glutamate-1-semialdehyde aminotransferase
MRHELAALIERFGFDAQAVGYGSIWLVLFHRGTVRRYEDLLANNTALDSRFRRGLFQRGVLSALVPMKRYNISLSHTDEHFAKTLQAAEDTLRDMARSKRSAATAS